MRVRTTAAAASPKKTRVVWSVESVTREAQSAAMSRTVVRDGFCKRWAAISMAWTPLAQAAWVTSQGQGGGTEGVLDNQRGRQERPVVGVGGDVDRVQAVGREACRVQGRRGGGDAHVGGCQRRRQPAAFPDAGAAGDPLVAGVQGAGELLVQRAVHEAGADMHSIVAEAAGGPAPADAQANAGKTGGRSKPAAKYRSASKAH